MKIIAKIKNENILSRVETPLKKKALDGGPHFSRFNDYYLLAGIQNVLAKNPVLFVCPIENNPHP